MVLWRIYNFSFLLTCFGRNRVINVTGQGAQPRSGSTGRATLWSRIASPWGAQSTADTSSRRGQALSGVPSKQGWTHAPTRGRSSRSRCSAQTLIHIRLHTVTPAIVGGNGVQPIQPGLDESEEKKPQRKKKNQFYFFCLIKILIY